MSGQGRELRRRRSFAVSPSEVQSCLCPLVCPHDQGRLDIPYEKSARVKVFARSFSPVNIQPIEAVVVHEFYHVISKFLSIARSRRDVAEYYLC
jgi:hypothetical protein